jgi:hypothetical protein
MGWRSSANPTAVERYLLSEGLPSKDLGLQRFGSALSTRAGVAQAGSAVAANSGRWVRLTEEAAQAIKKCGLRESSKSDLSTGVLKGNKGPVRGHRRHQDRLPPLRRTQHTPILTTAHFV